MAIYEALKDVATMASKANNIEIQRALMDVQQQALDIQAENQSLRSEVVELSDALAFKGTLVPEVDVYWSVTDSEKDGPYCTRCWDDEAKPIRLHPGINPGTWRCPKCDTPAGRPAGQGQAMARGRSVV